MADKDVPQKSADTDRALQTAIRLHRKGDPDTAAAAYRAVLAVDPSCAPAWINLGVLLRSKGQTDAAVICLSRGVSLTRGDGPAWSNLGNALRAANRLEEARHAQETAIDLSPGAAHIHYNLGLVYRDLGDLDAAQHSFRRAELLGYDKPDLAWDRALTDLLSGDLVAGFVAYESRWTLPENLARHGNLPQWQVGDDENRSILVHHEQGLGDTLQFCRYLPRLAVRFGTVVFEAQPPLIPLLSASPGFEALRIIASGDPVPTCDVQSPLLSLPRHFSDSPEILFGETPYLSPPPGGPVLHAGPDGHLKVGLVWAGKPGHRNDRNRSIALSDFARLLDVTGIAFHSFQVGPASRQIGDTGLTGLVHDCSPMIGHYGDTASLIAQLDLLISVDTSVAHLAGGMGVPVWTLLPFAPDWRWQLQRADTPWYPSMSLFRQTSPGDWREVIDRVRHALFARVRSSAAAQPVKS
ncbi:MAG: tetratricopeptide repeat-containing glycosyltransferase family protein [Alphaproteobacteria bacterium]